MTSVVEICNLALSHLGDSASVSSIDPPEGSAQAEHCARFYPIARDSLLEQHSWQFATRRSALAQVQNVATEWLYAYAEPNDCLSKLAVLAPDARDDYSEPMVLNGTYLGVRTGIGIYTPQPYCSEIAEDGSPIILTNQQNAWLRWVARVTDTNRFSPLFVETLAYWLASKLAGPVLKGTEGVRMGEAMAQKAMIMLGKAGVSDSMDQRTPTGQSVSWIAGR